MENTDFIYQKVTRKFLS
nr:DUF4765 family protein [Salmonella enterica]